jgi:uncharacterized protein
MNRFSEKEVLYETIIPGGWNFSHNLKRGTCLRLIDVEGGVNASALLYNSANYSERYNMADTLKAQYISCITTGSALYSDMGRILLSVIDDGCGWHDTITGLSSPESNARKYGVKTYGEGRNDYYRDSRTSLITEAGKYGMTPRDIHSNINFFTRVDVGAEGDISYTPQSEAGAYIDLQAEMDTLILLNTCPHVLDPEKDYAPKPLKVVIWDAGCAVEENPCYHKCEQNQRGFINTRSYYL